MDRCIVIGRGYNYATSFELALKLKELTYVMATSYSSADFRHGPIVTVEPGLPAILPGQLLALHLALSKGLNPDVPRGLQKVTRTL